jgi:hypothetical protein
MILDDKRGYESAFSEQAKRSKQEREEFARRSKEERDEFARNERRKWERNLRYGRSREARWQGRV